MVENLTRAVRDLDGHVADLRIDVRKRHRLQGWWTAAIVAAVAILAVVGGVVIGIGWQSQRDTRRLAASTAISFESVRKGLIDGCEARQQRDASDVAKDRALRDAEATAIPRAPAANRVLLQRQVDAYDAELAYIARHPAGDCVSRFGR